jgi:hypothetical protein
MGRDPTLGETFFYSTAKRRTYQVGEKMLIAVSTNHKLTTDRPRLNRPKRPPFSGAQASH